MNVNKPRRRKRNPFRPGGAPGKGSNKRQMLLYQPTANPAPPAPPQIKPKAVDFGPLVAAAMQRIAEPTPEPRWRSSPLALALLLIVTVGGIAWPVSLYDRPFPPPDAVSELATGSDTAEIKQLLRQLDFAPGPDGASLDSETREAIRRFQHIAGLPETGEPSAALLDELLQVAAPLKVKN